jgi:hypothetical protein
MKEVTLRRSLFATFAVFGLWALAFFGFWGTVIYVAGHFISKFW